MCPRTPHPTDGRRPPALQDLGGTCGGYGCVLSFVFIFVVLGLANFLVSCEVDKAVLQESWDLDVDTWSKDSCSSLYSISLRDKSGTSGV